MNIVIVEHDFYFTLFITGLMFVINLYLSFGNNSSKTINVCSIYVDKNLSMTSM